MQSLNETQFQLRWLVMPDYIYSDNRLTDVSRRVYCFIHSYKNPFFFGNEHLAEMFGVHKDTISGAIKQLEELKLITLKYKTKAGGGKIRLCQDTFSEKVSTPTREQIAEATKRSPDLHNDNENNEKDFLEAEIPTDLNSILPIRKKDRVYKIGGGYQKPFGNQAPYKKSFPENKPRKGRSAEDIR